jgi:hypothetical protein
MVGELKSCSVEDIDMRFDSALAPTCENVSNVLAFTYLSLNT